MLLAADQLKWLALRYGRQKVAKTYTRYLNPTYLSYFFTVTFGFDPFGNSRLSPLYRAVIFIDRWPNKPLCSFKFRANYIASILIWTNYYIVYQCVIQCHYDPDEYVCNSVSIIEVVSNPLVERYLHISLGNSQYVWLTDRKLKTYIYLSQPSMVVYDLSGRLPQKSSHVSIGTVCHGNVSVFRLICI